MITTNIKVLENPASLSGVGCEVRDIYFKKALFITYFQLLKEKCIGKSSFPQE